MILKVSLSNNQWLQINTYFFILWLQMWLSSEQYTEENRSTISWLIEWNAYFIHNQ